MEALKVMTYSKVSLPTRNWDSAKKKPTADAVGKDNSGWMFTDSECVCRPVGKTQRSRREASESVHLIELNERKLVVTDGLGNKLFHH